MRFTIKYLSLFCVCLILSGCGATGRLLGNITMLPINASKAVVRAASYQDGAEIPATDISGYNAIEAMPLHHID